MATNDGAVDFSSMIRDSDSSSEDEESEEAGFATADGGVEPAGFATEDGGVEYGGFAPEDDTPDADDDNDATQASPAVQSFPDEESISLDDNSDDPSDGPSFVTPAGSSNAAPTVAMPHPANSAPEATEVFPQSQPKSVPPKDNKGTRIAILVAIVVAFVIGVIAVYKFTQRPSTVSPAPTPSASMSAPATTQSPSAKASPSTSNSDGDTLTLETQAPNVDKIYQSTGIVQEKHIYSTDGQRFYALVFTVSNVSKPMLVFVPADTYAKVSDGDKYQIVYGQYADGMLGIRSVSSSVEN